MVDATARIKNLSIALEAISRINHPAAGNAFEAIEDLLAKEIKNCKKEQKGELIPGVYVAPHPTFPTPDDDIPF